MKRSSASILLFVLPVIGLVLGCGLLGKQTAEANKLVEEANALVKTVTSNDEKSVPLIKEFNGIAAISNSDDLEEFKTKNKAKFDELTGLLATMEKDAASAADKFDEASKITPEDKIKEYYTLQGQSIRKSSDFNKSMGAWIKSVLDTKDTDGISKMFDDFLKKRDAFKAERDDLNQKADKIVKDNPELFKK